MLAISVSGTGGNRYRGKRYSLKVTAGAGGEYRLESDVFWKEQREWCVAIVNDALKSAGKPVPARHR